MATKFLTKTCQLGRVASGRPGYDPSPLLDVALHGRARRQGLAAPRHRFGHASLVTARGHGAWQRLDALWLALCVLFRACACKRSPPTTATCHNPRPITHDPSLALADARAAAASPVKSRPKRHSARVCLSPSQTASCARPRAWASAGVDAAPCPIALEPLVDVRRVSRALRRRHVPPSAPAI